MRAAVCVNVLNDMYLTVTACMLCLRMSNKMLKTLCITCAGVPVNGCVHPCARVDHISLP